MIRFCFDKYPPFNVLKRWNDILAIHIASSPQRHGKGETRRIIIIMTRVVNALRISLQHLRLYINVMHYLEKRGISGKKPSNTAGPPAFHHHHHHQVPSTSSCEWNELLRLSLALCTRRRNKCPQTRDENECFVNNNIASQQQPVLLLPPSKNSPDHANILPHTLFHENRTISTQQCLWWLIPPPPKIPLLLPTMKFK